MSKNSLQGQARWMHSLAIGIGIRIGIGIAIAILCLHVSSSSSSSSSLSVFASFLRFFCCVSFSHFFFNLLSSHFCAHFEAEIVATPWNRLSKRQNGIEFRSRSRSQSECFREHLALACCGCKSIWPLAAALDWSEDTHTHSLHSLAPSPHS